MIGYDENTTMPFGKYKGSLLSDVPPEHLLWLYRQPWLRGYVRMYIFDNLTELKYKHGINHGGHITKK